MFHHAKIVALYNYVYLERKLVHLNESLLESVLCKEWIGLGSLLIFLLNQSVTALSSRILRPQDENRVVLGRRINYSHVLQISGLMMKMASFIESQMDFKAIRCP